jgi:hypothetical protein
MSPVGFEGGHHAPPIQMTVERAVDGQVPKRPADCFNPTGSVVSSAWD